MADTKITGGQVLLESLGGNAVAVGLTVAAQAMADADQTPLAAVYQSAIVSCTGALTAQRKLILPLPNAAGARSVWVLANNTTGGFGVQAIGATGSGVVVAAGKVALVMSDGTNIVRMTPDA